MDEQTTRQQEQIQEAVSQAVREAMREFVASMPTDQANYAATGVQEQVDKIYAEMEGQIEKQKELLEAINNISDSNVRFMEDVQNRLDQQAETSLRLVKEAQQDGGSLATVDFSSIKDNVSEFKLSIEQCSQTMDQLRKQLNRERNNNDRTITELYRSMKYSEERIEELHANYDEFTTIIQSHKGIMGILVWLNIIVIAALIALSLIQMLG